MSIIKCYNFHLKIRSYFHGNRSTYWVTRRKVLIIVVVIPIVWSMLLLPLILNKDITNTVYIENISTTVWAVIGYFFPVTLLIIFNVKLIKAIRESEIFQRVHTVRSKPFRNGKHCEDKKKKALNITLIFLVVMYIFLVSPSEIIHFWQEIYPSSYSTVLGNLFNLLQTINFSCTFLLYVSVNSSFRKSLSKCVDSCHSSRSESLSGSSNVKMKILNVKKASGNKYSYSWSTVDTVL